MGSVVIVIILIILLIIETICLILTHLPCKSDNIYKQDFQNEIKKIEDKIRQERDRQITQRTEEIKVEIDKIQSILNEKRENFNKQKASLELTIEQLNKDYEEKRALIEQSIQNYSQQEQEKMTQKLLDRQKEIESNLHEIEGKYQLTLTDYENRALAAKRQYEVEENELNEKIEEKKQEINNLIEQFKRDEELRKENDFYRITISETDKEDISKLKSMAAQLNNPSILYKLIWETYFKKGFDSMVGRVLGEDKDAIGIYKITNIKNQMCYIGQTRAGFKNRWRTHAKRAVRAEEGTSNRLYQAMWDEGLENFTFQVIEKCGVDKLTEREKFFISYYNSREFGYNSKT